jgi:hypothetical protein
VGRKREEGKERNFKKQEGRKGGRNGGNEKQLSIFADEIHPFLRKQQEL